MGWMTEWFSWLDALTKNNLMFAALFGGSGAFVLGKVFLALPKRTGELFAGQFITRLTLSNAGYGSGPRRYNEFLYWYSNQKGAKWSRSFSFSGGGNELDSEFKTKALAGYGYHWFIYRRHLVWFRKNSIESQGTTMQKEEINLRILGRSTAVMIALLEEFSSEMRVDSRQKQYQYSRGYWCMLARGTPRPLSSVFANAGIKDTLLKTINTFLASREWYEKNGIPYKLIILLHGVPGTGKTSLIRALTHQFNRDLAALPLHQVKDTELFEALIQAPKNAFLLMEDFESNPGIVGEKGASHEGELLEPGVGVNIQTVLNTFDGPITLDGQIIFLTTNHLEKIDDRVIRPGRVDLLLEIPPLTGTEVLAYLRHHFPDYSWQPALENHALTGAALQECLLAHKYDPAGLEEKLLGDASILMYDPPILKEVAR